MADRLADNAGSVDDEMSLCTGHTYAVLRSELLVKGRRHDLSSEVGGGIKVSLALGATRRGDHLEV